MLSWAPDYALGDRFLEVLIELDYLQLLDRQIRKKEELTNRVKAFNVSDVCGVNSLGI